MKIFLCRHGETEWSLSGKHTGSTDLFLTKKGEMQAKSLRPKLENLEYDIVFSSPMQRAKKTAELSQDKKPIILEPLAKEWNYGDFEGKTTEEIREKFPNWSLYTDGAPHGESPDEVAERADKLIDKWLSENRSLLLFAHGHILRMIAARWVKLAPEEASIFSLDTATLSVLGFEKERRVIHLWNT